jgi:hypothetical protein
LNLLDAVSFLALFPHDRRSRVFGAGLPLLPSNLVCVSVDPRAETVTLLRT